jgi:nucleoside-diphosphate-sugar epimerase
MSLSGEKIMVTGATGFLGNMLVRRLLDEGAQIRVLARSPEKARRMEALGAEIIAGDITDSDAVRQAVEGSTYVYHLAAALGGNLEAQIKANVEGTRTVMQAAGEAKVRRVVHVSTISVYGYRHTGDVTEDMPLNPGADPYPITKKQAEEVVRQIADQQHVAYSIIRPAMIYGPRSGLWTGQFFRLAKRNPTPFIGDGSGNTHPIYVDDVVEMLLMLATHPAAENQTFNCSADPAPTWREYLQGYSRLAGHQNWLALPVPLARLVVGMIGMLAPRRSALRDLTDMLNLVLSKTTFKTTKARECLGWKAQVSLEEGIERCAPWLREKGWLS